MVAYDEPGRYRPVLTVFDEDGTMLAGQVTISVTYAPSHVPRQSASIVVRRSSVANVRSSPVVTSGGEYSILGGRAFHAMPNDRVDHL